MSNALPSHYHSRLKQRHRKELRFKCYGIGAILVSLLVLVLLLGSIIYRAVPAFTQTTLTLSINLDSTELESGNSQTLVTNSLLALFPEVISRHDRRELFRLVSNNAGSAIDNYVLRHPDKLGGTHSIELLASSDVDMLMKGKVNLKLPEDERSLSDKQVSWINHMVSQGIIKKKFNTGFFTNGDSREPESAGMLGSILGSLMTLAICMGFAIPLAVLTAVYLEEFAPKNRLTDLIEVNINNLAAVPSIVYGLLGLAVFLLLIDMPRSSALAAGLTLGLMALPTMVITTRHALRAVPQSIRSAALALGASPLQVVIHHTIPLSMPGIMTGCILTVARMMGETAPLLMLGMIGFFRDIPSKFTDAATVMPVQIYIWSDSAEPGFIERTSAGILVLLTVMITINLIAVVIRQKFEKHW